MKMRLFFRRSINVAPLLGESHITVLIFAHKLIKGINLVQDFRYFNA